MRGAGFAAKFFAFGLAVEIFELKAPAAFCRFTLAVPLAAATDRRPEPPHPIAMPAG
jgi:hypothetical protein